MRHLWVALLVVGALTAGMPTSIALADVLRDSLDSSLAAGDVQQMISIMRDHKDVADQAEISDWLREKVDTGQAPDRFAMAMALLSLKEKKVDDALTYLSYYRALIVIDSTTCADPSSKGSLLEASIFLFGRLTLDKGITIDQKRNAVDRAMKLEAATSSFRKKDPSLCAAGLTAYAKDLHVPLQQRLQSADQDGQEPTPTVSLLYADDSLWREKRAEQLPKLSALLLMLNGVQNGQ